MIPALSQITAWYRMPHPVDTALGSRGPRREESPVVLVLTLSDMQLDIVVQDA